MRCSLGNLVRFAALWAALGTLPVVACAAPDETTAIPCATGNTEMLAGSQAGAGTRFRIAIGLTVATPVKPANGWLLGRCNSEQVFFTRTEADSKDVLTAVVSHLGLGPWTDEPAFEEQVRRLVDQTQPVGQHLKIVQLKASTVDGRPCVDVLRTGTVDPIRLPAGGATPPMFTRERLRVCHLRDARGPEATAMVMFKEIARHDPLRFDDSAQPFLAGVTLPPWSQ